MPIFRIPVVLHANCPHANRPHAYSPHANSPVTRKTIGVTEITEMMHGLKKIITGMKWEST